MPEKLNNSLLNHRPASCVGRDQQSHRVESEQTFLLRNVAIECNDKSEN